MSKSKDNSDSFDELREEMREEMAKLKDEIKRLSESIPQSVQSKVSVEKRNLGQSFSSLSEYVNDVVDGVMSGISTEIEKSLVDPTGAWLDRRIARAQAFSLSAPEAQKAASLMSAMASEHRLRILGELLYGGRYASELESALKDLSPSTISSHLKVLEEVGLIVQEGERGRYLVTLPGRIALKMATRLTRFIDRRRS